MLVWSDDVNVVKESANHFILFELFLGGFQSGMLTMNATKASLGHLARLFLLVGSNAQPLPHLPTCSWMGDPWKNFTNGTTSPPHKLHSLKFGR